MNRMSSDNGLARLAEPADYDAIAAVIDQWWGRPVLPALPRLFFDLFHRTSLVVDGPDGPDAFLVGILSPSDPAQAYIHFVGVSRPPASVAWAGCCTNRSSPWPAATAGGRSARSRPRATPDRSPSTGPWASR